jgi:hypothetical protein
MGDELIRADLKINAPASFFPITVTRGIKTGPPADFPFGSFVVRGFFQIRSGLLRCFGMLRFECIFRIRRHPAERTDSSGFYQGQNRTKTATCFSHSDTMSVLRFSDLLRPCFEL